MAVSLHVQVQAKRSGCQRTKRSTESTEHEDVPKPDSYKVVRKSTLKSLCLRCLGSVPNPDTERLLILTAATAFRQLCFKVSLTFD